MAMGTKVAAKTAGAMKGAAKALAGYSSIFHHLAAEHAEVATMMHSIARSSAGSSAREDVFAELRAALLAHAHSEEQEFYPVLRRFAQIENVVAKCMAEHKQIEAYLEELEASSKKTRSWMALFERFMRAVEAHVDREENHLFPKANELLSGDQAKQVYERYEHIEERKRRSSSRRWKNAAGRNSAGRWVAARSHEVLTVASSCLYRQAIRSRSAPRCMLKSIPDRTARRS
jgi:hemerythrin superfamily protein